jgi:Helix-turn-helix
VQFGEFLKIKRRAKKMSIRQLALYAGCSNSYLSLLERGAAGQRGPTPAFLRRLVEPLGVPYEVLMDAAGYKLQTEDDTLYSGSLLVMLRDALGQGVSEFAQRIDMQAYEVVTLESRGVAYETFREILQRLFGGQRLLTPVQKELLCRIEKGFGQIPDTSADRLAQILSLLLDEWGAG